MPLDRILSETGIKRKAIWVAPTRCRFCSRTFLDKIFKGERLHKIRCEHCGLVNAEMDIDDILKTEYQGLRYDMGTYGGLGNFPKGAHFKRLVKEAFGFTTDEQVEEKLREFEYGVKLKRKQKAYEEKQSKITIKRKGEESYQLGKKTSKE